MRRHYWIAIALLGLPACRLLRPPDPATTNQTATAQSLTTTEVSASGEQLEACRNRVLTDYNVPIETITVFAEVPDAQQNTIVNWVIDDGPNGFCRINNNNTILEIATGSPPPVPPTPVPSPSPTGQPTPSPTDFDPQTLVSRDRNDALALANRNGYTIFDGSNPNAVVLTNGFQQIILSIDQLNTVTAVTVRQQPTPTVTPTPTPVAPSPSPTIVVRATVGQLNSCRARVGVAFPTLPPDFIAVFAGVPDTQGNATILFETRNGAAGYCLVNPANTVTSFVVQNEGRPVTPAPVETGRPPVSAFW